MIKVLRRHQVSSRYSRNLIITMSKQQKIRQLPMSNDNSINTQNNGHVDSDGA